MPLRKYARKPKYTRKATAKKLKAPYKKRMRMARQMPLLPFPKIRTCTFLYKQPSISITSGALGLIQRFRLNSLFDFDVDNNLDDKQPLYFDQMFSDTGPYKYYKVNAWKTKVTFTNTSSVPLHVYYDQGTIGSIIDADTPTEVQNRPGVQYRMVTAAANAKPQAVFTSFKTTKSFAPRGVSSGLDYGSSWNNSPNNVIIGSLLATNISNEVTPFTCVISVQHTFYTTCYLQDASRS